MTPGGRKPKRDEEPPVWGLFHRRGSVQILWLLRESKVLRVRDLVRLLPQIEKRLLTLRLKEMREMGLVIRVQREEESGFAGYALTPTGFRLSEAAVALRVVASELEGTTHETDSRNRPFETKIAVVAIVEPRKTSIDSVSES